MGRIPKDSCPSHPSPRSIYSSAPRHRSHGQRIAESSPDLPEATIDAFGNLVFRADDASATPSYRADRTSGAWAGAQLDVLDDDVERWVQAQFQAVRTNVENRVKQFQEELADRKTRTRATIRTAYDAISTPAKKRYHVLTAMPAKINDRLAKEHKAVKAELELATLRLAEARLLIQETQLRAKDCGVSSCMKIAWVCEASHARISC